MRKQVISFTLEPELENYLRRMAERGHCSISQYLRDLLWSGYEIEKHANEPLEIDDQEQLDRMIKDGWVKKLPDGRYEF